MGFNLGRDNFEADRRAVACSVGGAVTGTCSRRPEMGERHSRSRRSPSAMRVPMTSLEGMLHRATGMEPSLKAATCARGAVSDPVRNEWRRVLRWCNT